MSHRTPPIMRKSTFILAFSTLLLFITACHHTTPEQKKILAQADSIISEHPDSVLHLLRNISSYRQLATPDRALYALLMTQALNKCDSMVASDTLIRIATDYYDKKEPVHAGYAWFYKGRCANNQGDAKGYVDAILKAQEYATQSKDSKLQGFIYGDKAKLHQQQNQLNDALHCYELAYSCFKKAGDTRNASVCMLEIGYSLYRNKDFHAALKYYAKAIEENPNMEPILLTSFRRQQCLAFYNLKDYTNAIKFARLSLMNADTYDYAKFINMAVIFEKLNNMDSAAFYLRKCIDPREMAPEYYTVWLNISTKQKNYKAVSYYAERALIAKDSLFQHSLSESFAGLEKKYRYENVSSQNKSLIIKNQHNNIIILLLLFGISLGGVTFTIFRNKRNKQLLRQQRHLTENERDLLKAAEEKSFLLQKQISTQQNALQTLSKLKSALTDQSDYKRNHKHTTLQQEQAAIDQIVQQVIENVDQLYPNFSKRLSNAYPDLLENEILICCFLLAGFDNVTIYTTLNLQPASYNVKRTTLRKKLGLQHERNLTDFLAKF